MTTSSAYLANLLVAEDDPRSRELITEVLRDAGYFVVEVANGERALVEMHRPRASFDLVVLDIQMPGLDGMSVARELRRDPKWEAIPILAVTAGADAIRVLESGCTAYVSKPIELNEVRNMVTQMLSDVRSGLASNSVI